jgi:heme-degrading monooxygenase HmoA
MSGEPPRRDASSMSSGLLCDSRSVVVVYARTSSWSGSPEALEAWADHAAAHVAPFVSGLPGNTGCVLLIDREGGRGMTLTLWDNEEAALASDRNAEQSRASTVAATGVELAERGRYEVVARV